MLLRILRPPSQPFLHSRSRNKILPYLRLNASSTTLGTNFHLGGSSAPFWLTRVCCKAYTSSRDARFLRQEICYITKHYENLQAREISNVSSPSSKKPHHLQINPNVLRQSQRSSQPYLAIPSTLQRLHVRKSSCLLLLLVLGVFRLLLPPS